LLSVLEFLFLQPLRGIECTALGELGDAWWGIGLQFENETRKAEIEN